MPKDAGDSLGCVVCGNQTDLVQGPDSVDTKDWCPVCVKRYQFLVSHRDEFRINTLEVFRQMMAIRE
jgi:hypothetical protein